MEARRARTRVPTVWDTILTIAEKKAGYRARPGPVRRGWIQAQTTNCASVLLEMIMSHRFVESPGLTESLQKSWKLDIIVPV